MFVQIDSTIKFLWCHILKSKRENQINILCNFCVCVHIFCKERSSIQTSLKVKEKKPKINTIICIYVHTLLASHFQPLPLYKYHSTLPLYSYTKSQTQPLPKHTHTHKIKNFSHTNTH